MDILRNILELPPMLVDLIRLSMWLLLLVAIFVPLEKLFAETPQKLLRKGLLTDLAYYFINNLLPKAVLVFPMALIAWVLHRVMPGGILSWAGSLTLWMRLGLALVVGELGFYWGHRWTHQIPFLWRFHSVHHSPESVDWLVNTHAHPLDLVFVRLCGFVPMYALGLAQPMVANQLDVVPLLVMVVATAWGFFIHANVRWRFGPLEWLLATPHFHHWHHTNDEHVDRNYASMLPIMDKLFGTAYLPARQWPPVYGIHGRMPDGLVGQLVHPFLPKAEQPPIPEPVAASSSRVGDVS